MVVIRTIFPEPITVHQDEELVIDQTAHYDENGILRDIEVHSVRVVPIPDEPHIVTA